MHYLPLDQMTRGLMEDNLAVQIEFGAAMRRHDSLAVWASINANHMLPSGSSLFHPHLQRSVDRFPSTLQRMVADVPAAKLDAYLGTEKRLGERYLGRLGCAEWVASFAPVGLNEIRAFVRGTDSPAALTTEQARDLAEGITRVLNFYAARVPELQHGADWSARVDGWLPQLALVCRSHPQPHYRSDVTYWERLHWQAMVDYRPEELAAQA